ncbi:hypothetical protein HMPREF1345_02263 [Enterococcus faecium TX1337RF]|nr:hypothetical protein HMPREF1345_02263 [Enterococcus faecium TX1337RF]
MNKRYSFLKVIGGRNMTPINKLNTNIFLYIGMILVILNAIFLDFHFFVNILGLALILFSSNIIKLIGNFLKDDH